MLDWIKKTAERITRIERKGERIERLIREGHHLEQQRELDTKQRLREIAETLNEIKAALGGNQEEPK